MGTDTSNAITVFACPPHCSAGGPQSDGGHLFDHWVEFYSCASVDGCGNVDILHLPTGVDPATLPPPTCTRCGASMNWTGGSQACLTCGLTHMDWCLMRPTATCKHKLVRSPRNPAIVTCSECGEGVNYLFGFPGSEDAIALGCRCPTDAQLPGLPNGMGWMVSRKCRLHTPDDELEVE